MDSIVLEGKALIGVLLAVAIVLFYAGFALAAILGANSHSRLRDNMDALVDENRSLWVPAMAVDLIDRLFAGYGMTVMKVRGTGKYSAYVFDPMGMEMGGASGFESLHEAVFAVFRQCHLKPVQELEAEAAERGVRI